MLILTITAAVEDESHAHRVWSDVCSMFTCDAGGCLTMSTREPDANDTQAMRELELIEQEAEK